MRCDMLQNTLLAQGNPGPGIPPDISVYAYSYSVNRNLCPMLSTGKQTLPNILLVLLGILPHTYKSLPVHVIRYSKRSSGLLCQQCITILSTFDYIYISSFY